MEYILMLQWSLDMVLVVCVWGVCVPRASRKARKVKLHSTRSILEVTSHIPGSVTSILLPEDIKKKKKKREIFGRVRWEVRKEATRSKRVLHPALICRLHIRRESFPKIDGIPDTGTLNHWFVHRIYGSVNPYGEVDSGREGRTWKARSLAIRHQIVMTDPWLEIHHFQSLPWVRSLDGCSFGSWRWSMH